MKINLLYDSIIFSLQKVGGGSLYWSELLKRALIDDRFFFKTDIYANAVSNIFLKEILSNSNKFLHDKFSDHNSKLLLERFRSPRIANDNNKKSILHSSYFRISKEANIYNVTTIHDFIAEKYYRFPRKFINHSYKKYAINHSQKIICVSENTKCDFHYYFPKFPLEHVHVIHNGVSNDFNPLNIFNNGSDKYLLFVGSRIDYKNFKWVVIALSVLNQFNLYIVGSPLSIKEINFLNQNLKGRFKIFTNVSTAELNVLYNSAFALIYPSSYEGFGIPVIEAMKAGCPVIALNKSSIPEISGNAAILMETLDIDLLKEKIIFIEKNRNSICKTGIINSDKFSWEKTYDLTTNLYFNLYD